MHDHFILVILLTIQGILAILVSYTRLSFFRNNVSKTVHMLLHSLKLSHHILKKRFNSLRAVLTCVHVCSSLSECGAHQVVSFFIFKIFRQKRNANAFENPTMSTIC